MTITPPTQLSRFKSDKAFAAAKASVITNG
uniref:Uncharacterized protein n=1 Tax=Anguilla anguilla TaxID=7936 RepID=A0A0E9VYF2_ANGAN